MSAPQAAGMGPDWAIAQGLSVIPLGPDKKPLIASWKPYQTRQPNAAEIASWKKLRPAAWAIVTGAVSKRVTLDFDGQAGIATMRKLGIDPHRKSPSGGYHADFFHPGWHVPTLNSKSKRELGARWPGLDIRADGGYCAFVGRSGSGKYEWLREDPNPYELDILPRELREFLGLQSPPKSPRPEPKGKDHTSAGRVGTDRLVRMALDRSGNEGRNNAGFWLAGQLRDNGYNKAEAAAAMRDYLAKAGGTNTKGQQEPYTEAEMLATLDQAFNRPAREPWKPNGHSAPQQDFPAAAAPGSDWKSKLILNDNGTPKALLANAILALRSAPGFQDVLAFNEFTLDLITLKPPPWQDAPVKAWTDHEDRLTADWLQHLGIYVHVDVAGQAVQVVAKDRPFHPVRRYLNSLKWDGVKRLDSWLSLYLGVPPTDYAAAVGSRWLISAVARIFSPGIKADCSLIFEGRQGIGKSRTLRILGVDWFTDELGDLGSKDAAMQTRGVWIIEIGELAGMTRSDRSHIKAFMSRSTDRFRPPYGRHLIESPRQCVFAGSSNKSTYLEDETGGRRFWPVACTLARIHEIERDRDQLWAEAVEAYRRGRVHWLDSLELNRLADQEQAARFEADPWDTRIAEFISKRDDTSVSEVLEEAIGKKAEQWQPSDQMRVGKSLVSRGWVRYKAGPKEDRVWRYRAPQLTLGI
jgi:predicted P-loop ATPase